MRVFFITLFVFSSILCHGQHQHEVPNEAKTLYKIAHDDYAPTASTSDRMSEVIKLLDKAIAIDSQYYEAWAAKLGYQCQLHWFELAIATTADITRIFPHETSLLFFKGILQFRMDHEVAATSTFRNLLERYDTMPEPPAGSSEQKTYLINKGLTIRMLGGVVDGNKILETLAANEPDAAEKKYILAYIKASREEIVKMMTP